MSESKRYRLFSMVLLLVLSLMTACSRNEATLPPEEAAFRAFSALDEAAAAAAAPYLTDGIAAAEDIPQLLSQVEQLAADALAEGSIIAYEATGDSVAFTFPSGVHYLYLPPVSEWMGSSIGTIEPAASQFAMLANYVTSGRSPDQAAQLVADTFPSLYTFDSSDNVDQIDPLDLGPMTGHKLLVWYGHGGWTKEGGPALCSSVRLDKDNISGPYWDDLENGSLWLTNHGNLVMQPSYLQAHLPDGSLDGCLVYLATCYSLADVRLAQVLTDKGAALVVGNSGRIRIRYNLRMMTDFLRGLTMSDEHGKSCTAEEALTYAKAQNGQTDDPFWSSGSRVQLYYPTERHEFRLYEEPYVFTEISFQHIEEDGDSPCEYAVVNGLDQYGVPMWEFLTQKVPLSNRVCIESFGQAGELYYLNDGGIITALDPDTGHPIWVSSAYGGASSTYAFPNDDLLLLSSSQTGPEFFAISSEGKVCCSIPKLLEGYSLPVLEGCDNDYAYLRLIGAPGGNKMSPGHPVRIRLSDWTVLDDGEPEEPADHYEQFLLERAYLPQTDEWHYGAPSAHVRLDINGDGVEELIITSEGSLGFTDFAVFTLDGAGNPVPVTPVPEDDLPTAQYFGGLSYDPAKQALFCSPLDDSTATGGYVYYTLAGQALQLLFTLQYDTDLNTGERIYTLRDSNGTQPLSGAEFDTCLETTQPLQFTPLP